MILDDYTGTVEDIRMLGRVFDKNMKEIYPRPELTSLYEELPTYFVIGEKEEFAEYVKGSTFPLRDELLEAMQEQTCSSVVLVRIHDNIFSMKDIVEGARRNYNYHLDDRTREEYERKLYIYRELCEK